MNFFSYFWVEIKRMLHQKNTWIIIGLTIAVPLLGYELYQPVYTSTKTSVYLANPAFAGAFGGAIFFILFTLLEFYRIDKNQIEVLTHAVVSPITLNTARLLSILSIAVMTQGMILVFYFPYTRIKMGIAFGLDLYIAVYSIVMLSAIFFAILFSASMYQITKRIEISFVLTALFVLFSISQTVSQDFILRWINPAIWVMSDDFGNVRVLRSVCLNRLFWILLLMGVWLFSILCVRKYKKGMLGSFWQNKKKFYILPLSMFCVIAGILVYKKQPFIDHSVRELDYENHYTYEFNENILYHKVSAHIKPNVKKGTLEAAIDFEIENISGEQQEAVFEINPGYQIKSVKANGKEIQFEDRQNDNFNVKEIAILLPEEKDIVLSIEYGGFPKEWNLREVDQGMSEISSDYICLANTEFIPYVKNLLPGNTSFQADVILPGNFTAISYAEDNPTCISENEDGTKTWRIEQKRPSAIFYAADFVSEYFEAADMQIQFIYHAKHKEVMDRIQIKDTLKDVFEYCNEHIGKLNFYDEKGLKLIETSAYMGGGYAGNGSSVIDENNFSEEEMNNKEKGASNREVMAHEIIHQWWGLGNMFEEGEDDLLWSAEGLTVYTTYRLMKEMYGEEHAKKYYVDLWQEQANRLSYNFYHRYPEYLDKLPEKYRAMILNEQRGILQYSVMPLKILKAEKLVGGEEEMDKILQKLFTREIDYSYPYLTYQDFLDACGLEEEDLELE